MVANPISVFLLQALTYFCIYVVRQGVTSWFVFYLMKVRRMPVLLFGAWHHVCRHIHRLSGPPQVLMTSSLCMHGPQHPAHQHAHSMLQVKGVADAGSAAVRVSGMELGGLFGSLLAGRLSDFLVRKFPNDGAVGKRVQVRPVLQFAAQNSRVQASHADLHHCHRWRSPASHKFTS